MNDPRCADCSHYLRHYTLNKRKMFRVYCGRFTFGRARRKLPDARICENFVPGPPQEEAFISREYLSKELLQYLLNLDPLPEIEDMG